MSPTPRPHDVLFLEHPEHLRDWFAQHHETAPELWLGSYKRSTGRPSISWSEAVDEALCVGWIDSIRYSLDDERSAQRFTPRRPRSHWSAINVRKVRELSAAGRMRPAGLAAFAARRADRTEGDPDEQGEAAALTDAETARIQANDAAWAHWEARPPGYKRQVVGWITSAKQPATRERRLASLIADSAAGRLVKPFRRAGS